MSSFAWGGGGPVRVLGLRRAHARTHLLARLGPDQLRESLLRGPDEVDGRLLRAAQPLLETSKHHCERKWRTRTTTTTTSTSTTSTSTRPARAATASSQRRSGDTASLSNASISSDASLPRRRNASTLRSSQPSNKSSGTSRTELIMSLKSGSQSSSSNVRLPFGEQSSSATIRSKLQTACIKPRRRLTIRSTL
ncbi:hypothetical protein BC830DRAFT_645299 [Chytriomyces sp. MP71]|nr:hypothetical protein BC830DRAFT_645299 [Chytriomyces sp. MP71]